LPFPTAELLKTVLLIKQLNQADLIEIFDNWYSSKALTQSGKQFFKS